VEGEGGSIIHRLQLCGGPRQIGNLCGAACSQKWEAGERNPRWREREASPAAQSEWWQSTASAWTKAVGGPAYEKKSWQALEAQLLRAAEEGAGATEAEHERASASAKPWRGALDVRRGRQLPARARRALPRRSDSSWRKPRHDARRRCLRLYFVYEKPKGEVAQESEASA